MSGTLYGVGVGPGDPELMTLKAARLVTKCPVLAYPATEDGQSMARTIASAHISSSKVELPLRMTMGEDRTSALAAYDKGAVRIAQYLDAGRDVAFICEGDPLLFGSFIYVMERLNENYPVRVVPGISSVMAAAAAFKSPLAMLDESLTVIPATRPQEDIARVLRICETVVLLKAGRHLEKIAAVLKRLKLTDDAQYIEYVGHSRQRIRPFIEAAEEGGPYFSLVMVRKND